MSDEPNPTPLTRELRERTAECDRLARAVLVAGVEAFKGERGALPLDLIMAYVAALATSIVAFDAVKHAGPGLVDELVTARRALIDVARRDADAPDEQDIAEAVTHAMDTRESVPDAGAMRCTNCGALNDSQLPMNGPDAAPREGAFAICALCQTWYRREGGTWRRLALNDLPASVRAQLAAVCRGVARSLRDRLERVTGPQH